MVNAASALRLYSMRERISTPVYVNPHNRRYLSAKGGVGRHHIELPDERGVKL